jgi:cell division protein ZapE
MAGVHGGATVSQGAAAMRWITLSQPAWLTGPSAGISGWLMSMDLQKEYAGRVAAGELQEDAAQAAAVQRLDALAKDLDAWGRSKRGLLRMFGGRVSTPKGLYVHGSVGRGKTMLMDLFYSTVTVKPKRRVHFHEFMADVHERIGEARKAVDGDPIPYVAEKIGKEARLLCFDELHVTDIADAMILGRLFKVLFADDVVVVATSNAHPTELYKNGLNRQLFLPFIELIGQHMDVLELDSAKDFRLDKLSGRPLYFTPLDAAASAGMDALWLDMTGSASYQSCTLEVKGRKVQVPRAAMGVARFDFADLCAKPLGSLDYLAIGRAFHTVMIDGIPVLTPARRNEARRFINLIDTLYDNRINLIASAEAEPDAIYAEGDGSDLFERTASRLIEMRSEEYLELRANRLTEAQEGSLAAAG